MSAGDGGVIDRTGRDGPPLGLWSYRPGVVMASVAVGVLLVISYNVADILYERRRVRRCLGSPPHAACLGIQQYVLGQTVFRKRDRYSIGRRVYANPVDGRGFPDLHGLCDPPLMDGRFARATKPSRALYGWYYFVDIAGDENGPFDFAERCGLCAVPMDPEGLTFIILLEGDSFKDYHKNTGGRPVVIWPDVEREGWRGFESPIELYQYDPSSLPVGAWSRRP